MKRWSFEIGKWWIFVILNFPLYWIVFSNTFHAHSHAHNNRYKNDKILSLHKKRLQRIFMNENHKKKLIPIAINDLWLCKFDSKNIIRDSPSTLKSMKVYENVEQQNYSKKRERENCECVHCIKTLNMKWKSTWRYFLFSFWKQTAWEREREISQSRHSSSSEWEKRKSSSFITCMRMSVCVFSVFNIYVYMKS